jgi:hypothetical protein
VAGQSLALGASNASYGTLLEERQQEGPGRGYTAMWVLIWLHGLVAGLLLTDDLQRPLNGWSYGILGYGVWLWRTYVLKALMDFFPRR